MNPAFLTQFFASFVHDPELWMPPNLSRHRSTAYGTAFSLGLLEMVADGMLADLADLLSMVHRSSASVLDNSDLWCWEETRSVSNDGVIAYGNRRLSLTLRRDMPVRARVLVRESEQGICASFTKPRDISVRVVRVTFLSVVDI
jgi:hypothetical protein